MQVTLNRTLLVAGTSVPAPSGSVVEVDDDYGKELLAEGLATAGSTPAPEPSAEPATPDNRTTKPTGPKETK